MWWLGLIQAGMGLYQMIRNQSEQNKLAKEKAPTFGLTPNMKSALSQSEQMAKMGYTPQEKAAFGNQISSSQNTAFRNAVDLGGGSMAKAIKGALNSANLNAWNQFAINDANLRRSNIANRNALYGTEQGLQNQNVNMQNQLLMRRAQSLGMQGQSGMGNIMQGLGGMFSQGGGNMFGKIGNTTTPTPPTTTTSTYTWGVPKNTWDAATNYGLYKKDMQAAEEEGNNPYYGIDLTNSDFYNIYGNGSIGGLKQQYR